MMSLAMASLRQGSTSKSPAFGNYSVETYLGIRDEAERKRFRSGMSAYRFTNSDGSCLSTWTMYLSHNPGALQLTQHQLKLIRGFVFRGFLHQLKVICVNLPVESQKHAITWSKAELINRLAKQAVAIRLNLCELQSAMAKGEYVDHLPLPYAMAMAVNTSTDLSDCLLELADSKVSLNDVKYLLSQDFANAFHALSEQCTAQIEQCHDLHRRMQRTIVCEKRAGLPGVVKGASTCDVGPSWSSSPSARSSSSSGSYTASPQFSSSLSSYSDEETPRIGPQETFLRQWLTSLWSSNHEIMGLEVFNTEMKRVQANTRQMSYSGCLATQVALLKITLQILEKVLCKAIQNWKNQDYNKHVNRHSKAVREWSLAVQNIYFTFHSRYVETDLPQAELIQLFTGVSDDLEARSHIRDPKSGGAIHRFFNEALGTCGKHLRWCAEVYGMARKENVYCHPSTLLPRGHAVNQSLRNARRASFDPAK